MTTFAVSTSASEKYTSITKDFRWHKFKDNNRWACHHCADHGFISARDEHNSGYTWDEWQAFVEEDNSKVISIIKEKDPEYYEYWFNGGREQELFGDDNEEEV